MIPEQTETCCLHDPFLPVKGTEGCGDRPLALQAAQRVTATVRTHAVSAPGGLSTGPHIARPRGAPGPGGLRHRDGRKLQEPHSPRTRTCSPSTRPLRRAEERVISRQSTRTPDQPVLLTVTPGWGQPTGPLSGTLRRAPRSASAGRPASRGAHPDMGPAPPQKTPPSF